MAQLDFPAALVHLMGRIGEPVEVSIGGADEASPPFVAELIGTLEPRGEPVTDALPELAATGGPVAFGFEEHASSFALDPHTFTAGHVRGDYLEIAFGGVRIEVRAPVNEDELEGVDALL
ncbi:MAG TPA: hypothetical protein VGV67_01925 [Solirubrobacteraceae bacterium]|nr:hypothetical protein [Solirubrobacteraceae bacterium]